MKFLYYTSVPWPHLTMPFDSFPHTNQGLDPLLMRALLTDSVDLFVDAERAGFDWLGVGEEHMNAYGVVPNPTLLMSAVAARTSVASLAVLGNPIPLLNPVRVAEEYAWLDVLSGGRLVAGFPRGVPQNFAAYGIDSGSSRSRLEEGVDLVRKAWTDPGPFHWEGEHFHFSAISIWPQPLHQPALVMSCKSPESVALAVRHRAIMAEIYVKNEEVLTNFVAAKLIYETQAFDEGWTATPDSFCLSLPCVIADSDEQAIDIAERALTYQATLLTGTYEREKKNLTDTYFGGRQVGGSSYDRLTARLGYGGVLCGSPSTVVDQIRQASERFGVGTLGLQMQFGDVKVAEVRRGLELFRTQVKSRVS
ncbi:LLM class flavin-dependent oxidoreductase [Rhodococcoides fascians]|uniref:LLM class flavin-dependent oxidoreductase n=1 Tax=Rhodococcoides fascians TaxID=1828 RepID=UPI002ACEE516|nr:LLM class flavin-dependent oxidoreductase [Rhodococcus fascians]WQH28760.1 LLM class flavin-dependent oxidoreductase [Rhodococcus fascians]